MARKSILTALYALNVVAQIGLSVAPFWARYDEINADIGPIITAEGGDVTFVTDYGQTSFGEKSYGEYWIALACLVLLQIILALVGAFVCYCNRRPSRGVLTIGGALMFLAWLAILILAADIVGAQSGLTFAWGFYAYLGATGACILPAVLPWCFLPQQKTSEKGIEAKVYVFN